MRKKLPFRMAAGVILLLLTGFAAGRWLFPAPRERIGGPRYLIVNADDLGLSEGVTEGIVRAWREGIVTSTSAMINVEGAPEQTAAVHAEHPDLPIGLHLNITTGQPVLPFGQVPTLVDASGQFYSIDALLEHLPEVSLDELYAELRAQAERMLFIGVPFDHIDYHEGILMMYPPFYQVVRDLAREYGVPVRQPVPESVYGHVQLPGGGAASAILPKMIQFGLRHPILAQELMSGMTPAALEERAALLNAEGIPAPNWYIDANFGNASVENFVAILEQLPPGVSEVMAHPGLVDDQLRELGAGYVEQREAELAVLLDPRLPAALAANRVKLVDFSFVR